MKVRWTRDSLRLRITPSELAEIEAGQSIQESLGFPGGHLWMVTIRPTEGETVLTSDERSVLLSLSIEDWKRLALPMTEGVYFQQAAPLTLRYCVEKDFPCVHPRAAESQESPTETFPEPPGFDQRKSGSNTDGE